LFTDSYLREKRSHLPVEAILVHAKEVRRVAKTDEARHKNAVPAANHPVTCATVCTFRPGGLGRSAGRVIGIDGSHGMVVATLRCCSGRIECFQWLRSIFHS
jgi:hypothetical protein